METCYTPEHSSDVMVFQDSLKNYLRLNVIDQHPYFQWKCIHHYLQSHRRNLLSNPEWLSVFCEEVAELLIKYDCEEMWLITGITDLKTAYSSPPQLSLVSDFNDCFPSQKHLIRPILRQMLSRINNICNCGHASTKGMMAILNADIGLLKILSKYGMNIKISQESSCLSQVIKYILMEFTCVFMILYDVESIETRHIAYDGVDGMITQLLAGRCDHRLWCSLLQPPSLRRLFLSLLGIHALTLNMKVCQNLKNYIACVRLYYQTVPDCYATIHEISKIIMPILNYFNKSEISKELHQSFEELFPEARETCEPRSLIHLARCQVRKNILMRGSTPPEVNWRMNIAMPLKKAILCTISEFDLKHKY